MIGLTIMNGIDDYPRRTEVTTLAHTTQIFNFARSKGMNTLSMWAIQRDNGGCPRNGGAPTNSGSIPDTPVGPPTPPPPPGSPGPWGPPAPPARPRVTRG